MKFLFKWTLRLLLLLVVVLVILALSADTIVTSIAESRLRKQTGLEVRLGELEVRPLEWPRPRGEARVLQPR